MSLESNTIPVTVNSDTVWVDTDVSLALTAAIRAFPRKVKISNDSGVTVRVKLASQLSAGVTQSGMAVLNGESIILESEHNQDPIKQVSLLLNAAGSAVSVLISPFDYVNDDVKG